MAPENVRFAIRRHMVSALGVEAASVRPGDSFISLAKPCRCYSRMEIRFRVGT